MANETQLTIVGSLTADPDMRTTNGGKPVANFTIASNPRVFNRQTNQWEDGEALFMRCSAWNNLADHIGTSLAKGMRVIAQGTLSQRSYQAQDGSNRTVIEMTVQEIGPSLRYAKATVQKDNPNQPYQAPQSQGFNNSPQTGYQQPRQQSQARQGNVRQNANADPWGGTQKGYNDPYDAGNTEFGASSDGTDAF